MFAWFYLRGRCRTCGNRISFQYPLVEATSALLFALSFWSYYIANWHPPFGMGLAATWPVLLVHLSLIASLFAATIIDARLYIIPLEIPWFVTLLALVALPLSSQFLPVTGMLVFRAQGRIFWATVGAVLGLVVALVLLRLRWISRSFDEAMEPESDAPEAFLAHPHPRREVAKECLFLLPPILGAVAGLVLSRHWPERFGLTVEVAGGVLLGYLVGGACVWFTRIGGTLGFGKEAMGLGDVHLMGAIGAVLGPCDALIVFFGAPFLGLGYTLLAHGMGWLGKSRIRVIPYGPYLSAAAVFMMIFRLPMSQIFNTLGVPLP